MKIIHRSTRGKKCTSPLSTETGSSIDKTPSYHADCTPSRAHARAPFIFQQNLDSRCYGPIHFFQIIDHNYMLMSLTIDANNHVNATQHSMAWINHILLNDFPFGVHLAFSQVSLHINNASVNILSPYFQTCA